MLNVKLNLPIRLRMAAIFKFRLDPHGGQRTMMGACREAACPDTSSNRRGAKMASSKARRPSEASVTILPVLMLFRTGGAPMLDFGFEIKCSPETRQEPLASHLSAGQIA